jgi:hypothetical protein
VPEGTGGKVTTDIIGGTDIAHAIVIQHPTARSSLLDV